MANRSTRPGARGLCEKEAVAGEHANLHEREHQQEQDRQQERELHHRRALLAVGPGEPPPRAAAYSALPATWSMMSSKRAGSLPDERAHAMSTTATAPEAYGPIRPPRRRHWPLRPTCPPPLNPIQRRIHA